MYATIGLIFENLGSETNRELSKLPLTSISYLDFRTVLMRKQKLMHDFEEKRIGGFRKITLFDSFYVCVCVLIILGMIKNAEPPKNNPLVSPQPVKASEETILPVNYLLPTPMLARQETWEDFLNAAQEIAPIYNYPVKVVIAQAALESARGKSKYARERNNYFGLNAVDANPDQAYWYENARQSIIDYMITIRANFPEAWANRHNPEELVRLLKENSFGTMYASDPHYVSKVMSMKEWREY